MKPFYQFTIEETLQELDSSPDGLKESEITSRQSTYGLNDLVEAKRKSKLSIFIDQLRDVMILILVGASIISFFIGEVTDAFVILAIILGNAIMGFVQENQAEESMLMLKKMTSRQSLVLRDQKSIKVEASQLVPGDIILLAAGDVIPADARLIEADALKADEASLTGESESVNKITDPVTGENLVPGDQLNLIFKGTVISNGSGKAVVTATGMKTEIGKIAGLLDTASQKTPLQKRLDRFSKQLTVVVLVISMIIMAYGLWRGETISHMLLIALSIAVAALPEALPAVITIALAKGASRMARQNALIRKLPAVETLGSVTYICTDKTGTLTKNEMNVEKVQHPDDKEKLLELAMLLNHELKESPEGGWIGDSTEIAMVNYAISKGYDKQESDTTYKLISKLPFDSERMLMSTLHAYEGKYILLVKGAPARIADALAPSYKQQKEEWLENNREWASEGLRILFFAYKILDTAPEHLDESIESDLDYLGMAALIDPPREEVIDAIRECRDAGIHTVMITGDQALTAKAIAERLHIGDTDAAVMTGKELKEAGDDNLLENVLDTKVYARVSPEQKLNIVKALQHHHQIVSMTGDGINDAPSLKQADIGVAMGITGTDVSKEASAMILLDDNFATIVKAIREGRKIYENIRKFIAYILSCNLAEILTLVIAPILGFPFPLLPIHILWINLVTDGLPGIALVTEHGEKDLMKRPPRNPKESIWAGGLLSRVLLSGVAMAMAALFIQWWSIQQNYELRTQQTLVFTTLCFIQLGNALCVRSFRYSLFSGGFFSNKNLWWAILGTIVLQLCLIYIPFLQPVFKTAALEWIDFGMILLLTVGYMALVELIKWIGRKTGNTDIKKNKLQKSDLEKR